MKDFGRWFTEQGEKDTSKEEVKELPQWPYGIWQNTDGKYMAFCRKCGNSYEVEIDDPMDFDQNMAYCNSGSPTFCQP